MGIGYTRNDGPNNIANGNVIDADDLDGEFDAIVDAFASATGHTHDGTTSEGGAITVVGPAQEFIADGTSLSPKTDATYDLGKAAASFNVAYVETLNLGGTALTATATELNYTDGVTSAIQTQLNAKQPLAAVLTNTTASFLIADESKLDGIETNADVTDTANVTAAGALMDSEVDADIKTLVLPASTTISTFGASLVDDTTAAAARTTLGLGTAATTASTAYATAAQGTTANAALPKAGGAMTGAITTTSTFDGRDVATDGTKLDTIETNADVTDTANVTAAGALMDSEVDADIKTLSLPANTTISTFGASLVNDTSASAARTTLGLGTAATTASTAYATSTQGTTADNALPKSGGAMTGAVTSTSTFDGRDLSVDGAKLDGIEAGANVTDTANVTAAGALMDSEVDADIKTLSLPASTTISAFGASLVDDSTAANARTTLGLGSLSTSNTTLGNLATSNTTLGNLATSNTTLGSLATSNATISTYGATLTDDTTAANARTTLGLGSLATSNVTLGNLATSNSTLGALGTANTVNLNNQTSGTLNLANKTTGTLDRDKFEGYNAGSGISVNNSTGAITSTATAGDATLPLFDGSSASGTISVNNGNGTNTILAGGNNGRYFMMLIYGANTNWPSRTVRMNGSNSWMQRTGSRPHVNNYSVADSPSPVARGANSLTVSGVNGTVSAGMYVYGFIAAGTNMTGSGQSVSKGSYWNA